MKDSYIFTEDDNGTNVDAIKDIFIAAQNDYEKSEDLLKQLFPIGTVVVYNKSLMKKLEKIYTMENLKGTQLYIVKERKCGDFCNLHLTKVTS